MIALQVGWPYLPAFQVVDLLGLSWLVVIQCGSLLLAVARCLLLVGWLSRCLFLLLIPKLMKSAHILPPSQIYLGPHLPEKIALLMMVYLVCCRRRAVLILWQVWTGLLRRDVGKE